MLTLYSLKYLFKGGFFIPFKVFSSARIHCARSSQIRLKSRLSLGNTSDHGLPVVSLLPVNLYFGENSQIQIGDSVSVGPGINLIVKKDAKLSIGDDTYFTSDSHIEVLNSLKIGKGCAISWGVTIIDDDHHKMIPYSVNKNSEEKSIIIGDKVWVGCNVTILKNTIIGNNCVIAANSLVRGHFPDNSLIGGNPAKVIRTGVDWE